MQFASFQDSVQWVLAHGYALFFVAMLIEGPVVTAAGAFVANLGYFNIWAVFLLSILGNLIPDIIFYAMGYWGRFKLVDKYSHYFGVSVEKVTYLEHIAKRHAGKAITVSKLVPFLATPGLMIMGAVRMPLKKYVIWSLALILPSSLFFLIVGYYFGSAYNAINHYLNIGGYLIIVGAILFFVIYLFYRKISRSIAEKIEKNKELDFYKYYHGQK
jgi:membrane protein DedA with SNARE-associated domain